MDGNNVDVVISFLFGVLTTAYLILECVKLGIIKKDNFE